MCMKITTTCKTTCNLLLTLSLYFQIFNFNNMGFHHGQILIEMETDSFFVLWPQKVTLIFFPPFNSVLLLSYYLLQCFLFSNNMEMKSNNNFFTFFPFNMFSQLQIRMKQGMWRETCGSEALSYRTKIMVKKQSLSKKRTWLHISNTLNKFICMLL